MKAAQKAQEDINVLRAAFKLGTVPSILKKAVELSGIPVGPARLPVSEPNEESIEKIKESDPTNTQKSSSFVASM